MADHDDTAGRINDFLGSLIADGSFRGGGMVQSWICVGSYMDAEGGYRTFVMSEPNARTQSSLGWAEFAAELYREEVRDWRRAPEDD